MSKASCLKYVGGSHRWGKWFIPKKFASLNNYTYKDPNIENTDKAFEDIPDIDAHPEKYQLFAWDLEVMTNLRLLAKGTRGKATHKAHSISFLFFFPFFISLERR